jgi:hypothetical protein
MTGNAQLAATARETAGRAPAGSMDRRAYGCAAVALLTTGTIAGARRALTTDCPDAVKSAALEALDQLARSSHPEGPVCPS